MMEKLSPFIGVAIVGIVIYLGIKIAPPFINDWQFQDYIDGEARLDTYNNKSEQDIRKDVMKSARENDIPITDEKLVVQRGNGSVTISTKYTVHVDLPGYPIDFNFNPASKNTNPVVR